MTYESWLGLLGTVSTFELTIVSKVVSRAPMNYRDFLEDQPPGIVVSLCWPSTNLASNSSLAGAIHRGGFALTGKLGLHLNSDSSRPPRRAS